MSLASSTSRILTRTITTRTLALFRPLRIGAAVLAYSTRIPTNSRVANQSAWAVVSAAAGSAATYYLYFPRGPRSGGPLQESDPDDLTRRIQFPISQAELDEFLRKEQVFYVPPAEVISAVVRVDVDLLESNNPIEDRYTANVIAPNGHASLVFGVLDGHWDATCADVVTKALPAYVSRSIADWSKEDHPTASQSGGRADRVKGAITAAFEELDRDLMNLPLLAIPNFEQLTPEEIVKLPDDVRRRGRDAIVPALTGTCAVLSYIDGDDLYVAHAGDSRAVLGVQTPNGLQALELTRDHQPSNPDELARLKAEHPGEENTVAYRRGNQGPLRVIGGMMPTRAFGDAKFKWPLEWHAKIDALLASVHPPHKHVFTTSKHCFTPPYMTARPDIVHRQLNQDDSFIVLASDGIFDYLNNDDVVAAVDQYLQAALTSSIFSPSSPSPPPSPPSNKKLLPVVRDTNAATHVVRTALSHGKGDKEAARMLSLSSEERRSWRDDMTVVVIFLRGSAVAKSAGIPAVSTASVSSTIEKDGSVEGVVDVNVDFGMPRVVEHLENERIVVGEHLRR